MPPIRAEGGRLATESTRELNRVTHALHHYVRQPFNPTF